MASRQGGPGAGRATGPDGDAAASGTLPRADAATRPPRDPTRFSRTDHFERRLRQRGRYLSLPLVSAAITHGQLRWNTTDGWRFAHVVDGVRVVVVVGDADTPSPVLVTGWTEVADWEAALAADRWSEIDVQTIKLRADLSADPERRVPGRIRPRVVSRPFDLAGHRVTTRAGEAHVECADCGASFRSKRGLERRACE